MEADRDEHTTLNKGHGRVEHRRLVSSTMLNEYANWPGLKQVCQITRTRKSKGKTTTEIAYGMTSVGRERANAETLLKWNRGHWGIENRLHWVRDETFGEDRSRVRSGNAPQLLASIRNLAINWLRSQGIDRIAESLHENCWNPQRFFAKMGKPYF